MRTATVTQLQRNLGEILRSIDKGEEVEITRRNRVVAKLIPTQDSNLVIRWPDFLARARKTVGKGKGKAPSRIITESREERL
jgi:prevent-host-death family protein